MKKYGNNGFTLIEIMIVVTIIGILSMIAYPNYREYVRKTHRATVKTVMTDIATDLQHYHAIHGSYFKPMGQSISLADLGWPVDASQQVLTPQHQPVYQLSLTDVDAGYWVLQATPVSGSIQAADGILKLDAKQQRCWNKETQCTLSADSHWDGP